MPSKKQSKKSTKNQQKKSAANRQRQSADEEAAEKEEAEQGGDIMSLAGALDQPMMLHRPHNNVNVPGGGGGYTRFDDPRNSQHFVSGELDPLAMMAAYDVTKISHKGVETVQEFVTEFILFVTSEARDKAEAAGRHTIQG